MKSLLSTSLVRRVCLLALPMALFLTLLLPATGEAHAILLRSDPAKDAVLHSIPTQVRMWFSEDLNPTFSTARVVNSANQQVDAKNAHVTGGDPREMDLSLQPNLQPSVYIVIWRTQSADDGHVLTGSFLFTIARADGSVPTFNGTIPSQGTLGGSSNNGDTTGQFDGPTLFSFLMVTLVDLGVVFWVGAQLWRTFVPQSTDDDEQKNVQQHEEARFDRLFALPTLLVTLVANVGVLVGQGLVISGGDIGPALSFSTLSGLASNGRFGTYWTMRAIVLVLAVLVAIMTLRIKRPSRLITDVIPWTNFVLGLALLIAMTLSGHAAATNNDILVYAILVDWLHLLAAALWIGGMLYITLIYLPVLKELSIATRTKVLLTSLSHFSPLAFTGVVIMAISGPFNATVHMSSLDQLFTTAYGRTLDIKVLCVVALLITSAIHVLRFRPQLIRDYKKYAGSMEATQAETETEEEPAAKNAEQSKRLEREVVRQTTRLTKVLRWEPLLGVAVLICTGLLSVFGGTLLPPVAPVQASQGITPLPVASVKPFNATAQTSDKLYTIQLNVSPNRFGPNVFTVKVLDRNGKQDSNVGVSIYTTMLDMDMGTDTINLQPDGKGSFKATGDLSMPGHWQLRIQIRTLDNKLHETKVRLEASE
jgi:copper transport protein